MDYQNAPAPGQLPGRPPPKTSAMAITALVLSLLFFLPLVPLVGGILGIVATVRISRRRHELSGMGLAVAAIPTGFVIFLFTIGIYAAIAIPAFVSYARKAKTTEATEMLAKLSAAARSYYDAERFDQQGAALPRRFPAGGTEWTPALPCCAGAAKRCAPDEQAWQAEPWRSLRFSMPDPHYFQYRYRSAGEGAAARFVAEARGDLDCDGVYSSYTVTGDVDEAGNAGASRPTITDELE